MNSSQLVALISLLGFLVLVVSGFGAHGVDRKRKFYMASSWAGIFAIVILFIAMVR